MTDDLLTDDLLTQDHKRLREYHAALRDALRAYQEQQPIVPDLGDVLADAAKAVADKEQQELTGQLEQARRIAVELENEVARLRDLVADFTDSDPCHYDHHGYCQAHFWFQAEPACPHRRARELEGGAA
ncbi:hypothetical protein ADK70_12730 [Streptomyces rimosus subsp. pseudoverticillatus]|uniref:hypothetical protein n=1 Tax=Streptomyces rimosus TaxID=1927 RepID=UPI0006B26B8D|nr:hypothetical protein [Streptomyces rimosus]KOT94529.1 hypothetical protein ADK70_12730 [Streptomyces rimosus subsp. pseudoverticillatus]